MGMTDVPGMSRAVTMYTDGACLGNPGPGGWAAILLYQGAQRLFRRDLTGGAAWTTNNQMELQAAIEGLAALTEPCTVTLWTDSQYMRLGITSWVKGWQKNGWRTATRQPVKNADLWRRLLAEVARHDAVMWEWTKGHANNDLNNAADVLARTSAQEYSVRHPSTTPS